jgi:Fic family protein
MIRDTGITVLRSLDGKKYNAFIPHPLPPSPPLEMAHELYDLLEKANRALGRLDGVTTILPDAYLFTYFYLRKEAVLSSQIEGTQSSLSELLLFENEHSPGVPLDDPKQVLNYVNAMYHGLKSIKGENSIPLSLRLLKEMHMILLSGARGQTESPGEFRSVQNWIGGTHPSNAVFVGPPQDKVMECLDAFERFLHGIPEPTPVLIKAALAHVQFETIHPFKDGNGRLGRLLITLLLCAEGALSEPMLYLSLFFKAHRQEYYSCLQDVREKGDWESWLRFMLTGVIETAEQACSSARQILQLFNEDRKRIESLGRIANSMLRVHWLLQSKAIISIKTAVQELGLSEPTVGTCINRLIDMKIVREATGWRRNRTFLYDQYIKILNEGTESLATTV